jgi:hypothetical protein
LPAAPAAVPLALVDIHFQILGDDDFASHNQLLSNSPFP